MWPGRALPGVLRALGGAPRLVLRFWEHYEVGLLPLHFVVATASALLSALGRHEVVIAFAA